MKRKLMEPSSNPKIQKVKQTNKHEESPIPFVIPGDMIKKIGWDLTPDPTEFRHHEDVHTFVQACSAVVNMSMVCTEWAAFVTAPTLSKEEGHFGVTKFIMTAKKHRMKSTGRAFDWKNPYKRKGTKKRVVDRLLKRIAQIPSLNKKGVNFKGFELPLNTFDEIIQEELAYRMEINGKAKDKETIRGQVLKEWHEMDIVHPFIHLYKKGRSWIWEVREIQAMLDYITTRQDDLAVVEFWNRASAEIRVRAYCAAFDCIVGSDVSKVIQHEKLKNTIGLRLTTIANMSPHTNATKWAKEIEELVFLVYDDNNCSNVRDILVVLDKICISRGMWLSWVCLEGA